MMTTVHILMKIQLQLRSCAAALTLSLLAGCTTAPSLPHHILTNTFLPENNRILKFMTTSAGDTQATYETWIAQALESDTYAVATTNQEGETVIYTHKSDGLYILYPQADRMALILPNNTQPGMSWTDADGVTSTLVKQYYYRAPDREKYHCIEIKVDYPATAPQPQASQREHYAAKLGLVKIEYNDSQKTVKALSALGSK